MSKASGVRSRDLTRVKAASLLSLVLMVLPFGGLPKAIALVPLVLVLPGYAISAAMFMPGSITRGERLAYTLSLSVGAAAIGGLAWQLLFGLSRASWAFVLVAIVLVAAGVARRRRGAMPPGSAERRSPLPRLGLPTALAVLAAVILTVVAVDVAIEGMHDQRAESHFSSLWVLPHGSAGESVEIGVQNHQGAVYTYRLNVTRAGIPVWLWKGRLGAHKLKQVVLNLSDLPGAAPLVVTLYKSGVPYRRAELQLGSGA
ncbi:MAG TPA: hypothetical protein VFJ64_01645 [Solirubrobacterales bacterium]|nr:hypothetical protein [Solirubrobacterales bacterium]